MTTSADRLVQLFSVMILTVVLILRGYFELRNLRKSVKNMQRMLQRDALTLLPNREFALENLSLALQSADRNNSLPTVIHLNVDRFKSINDNHGHIAGDALLIEISKRLRDSIDERCIVARLSGDEFVVLVTTIRPPLGP